MRAEPPTVRPRQHVLEDLSERAFTNITPAEWVARPVAKDYGIDFEVEIFDQSGRRTGLTYKVQLKSTDATSRGRSVRVSDLEYWNSLDVPVLLVLHRAGSNETFSTWAHAHNPWPPVEDQATTTVHFTERYSDHVERIPDELELIRDVKQKATKLPVTIGVTHAESPTARTLRGELRAAVEKYGLSRMVKVVSTDPYITISMTDVAMSASSPTNASSTTAHGQDITHPADPAQRASHQLVLVAMALSQLRSDHAAGELLTALRRHISDNMLGTTADGIATAFARDHRWGDLLAMLAYVGSDAETTTRVLDVVERYARHMPPKLAAEFIDHCRQNAAYLTSIDLPSDASQRHFVASQIAVDHDLWEDVKTDLAAAARILPSYYENDVRYCQLAGKAEWNTDDREAALPWYERAWNLGWQTEQSLASYAEALIVNGKYGRARDLLGSADPDLTSRWSNILRCSVDGIVELTGITEQTRRPFTDQDPADDELENAEDSKVVMGALRQRDAFEPALLARYLHATEFTKSGSLGAAAWVSHQCEELSWWLWTISAAYHQSLPVAMAQAIVESAALDIPDIADHLDELIDDEDGPVDPVFVEWAKNIADNAEPYDGPPVLDEDTPDPRVRVTSLIPPDHQQEWA